MSALAPLALLVLPLAQEPAGDGGGGSGGEIHKLLEQSISARAVIRPQAARRLVGYGKPAADAVLARAGAGTAGLAALGADLVEVLGEFGDDRLRARLWEAADDLDFPWRPAAARGLAATALSPEGAPLDALLDDRIAAVRVAAVRGLTALRREESLARLAAALDDSDGRVRRAAADALLGTFGRPEALRWLLLELEREDRFFQRDTGKQARFEAFAMLRRRFPDVPSFRADLPPGDPVNAAALAWLQGEQRASVPDGAARPAPHALPGRVEGDVVLGVEVRSCRRGELYLRVTADDVLWVGLGRAARAPLPEGTAAALVAATLRAVEPLGEERFWGRAGCDLERLLLPGPDGLATYHVQKGPDAAEDLRPGALGRAMAAVVAALGSLPAESGDPRLDGLRAQLSAGLAAVGGPLPSG